MKNYACITVLGLLLAGCGGGGGSGGGFDSEVGGGTMNGFTAFVSSLVSSSPDDSEPQTIDSVAADTSETSEPSPVM